MTTSSFIDSVIEINIYLISLSILWFLVRQKLSFIGQRFLLISIPILAMLIWVFKGVLTQSGIVYAVIPIEAISIQSSNIEASSTAFHFSIDYLYWIGVAVFLALFVIKIIRVLFFFKDAENNGLIKLTNSTNEDSFSFFNFIHLRADLDEEEKNVVLEHELIHYQKRHSFDLMIYEIYHSLFWFNPLMILLKKELVNIHEFEVDQEMYATHKTDYMRHLLSYALGSNDSHYLLTSPFYNKLTLKKRIKTMKNSNRTNSILLLLALPVLAIAFTVVSCESENLSSPSEPAIDVVVDSQHFDKQAEFPGGRKALIEYLSNNTKYPKYAKEKGIEGRVIVQFVVNVDGSISNLSIKESISDDLNIEAIRVIESMPNWSPAEMDGKKVKALFSLPIVFTLSKGPSTELLSKQAEFVGGNEKLFTYIGKNVTYPDAAKQDNTEGTVFIRFSITEKGNIQDAKVLRGVSLEIDAEAIRVINSMPDWTPAEMDGKSVLTQMTLPIAFKLK